VTDPLQLITIVVAVGYFTIVGTVLLWFVYRRRYRLRTMNRDYRPGVTVLKPIAGVDESLESNLVSFFELDYEPLQIIFGCDRDDDPGIQVVRKVAKRYPQRDVLILTGCEGTAASPKIVNLEAMLPHAKHELVLLSDSNVRIYRDEMARLVQPMADERIGLVFQPVIGVDEQTSSAAIENLRLSEYPGIISVFSKIVHAEDCVMGKGMLCRRKALESIGDFAAVRDTAADDFLLGIAIRNGGWKLYISEIPAWTVHIRWPWKSYFRRQLRHAGMRFRMAWWGYMLECLGNPPMIWLLMALVGGWNAWPYIAGCIAVKTVCEPIAVGWIRSQPMALRHWWVVTFKDASMIYVLVRAMFDNRVHWRGKDYRMVAGTKLIRINADEARNSSSSNASREETRATIGK
jgi:ceramide glucosyltransferase